MSFNKAFADARRAGKFEFEYKGKKYHTGKKSEGSTAGKASRKSKLAMGKRASEIDRARGAIERAGRKGIRGTQTSRGPGTATTRALGSDKKTGTPKKVAAGKTKRPSPAQAKASDGTNKSRASPERHQRNLSKPHLNKAKKKVAASNNSAKAASLNAQYRRRGDAKLREGRRTRAKNSR